MDIKSNNKTDHINGSHTHNSRYKHTVNFFSSVINIIITLTIVGLILLLVNITNAQMTKIRYGYMNDFMTILELAIEDSDGTVDSIDDAGLSIINYIDSIMNKSAEVYNENYELESKNVNRPAYIDIKKYPDFLKLCEEHESGEGYIEHNNMKQEVFFKWVDSPNKSRKLLIVYSINSNILNFSFVFYISYSILILTFILALKDSFINRALYIQMLEKTQRRRRDDFSL